MHRSVFVKVALGFLFVYTLASIGLFFHRADIGYKKYVDQSMRAASNYSKIGRVMLREGDVADLAARLDDAMQAWEIDFYQIKQGGEVLAFGSNAGADEAQVIDDQGKEGIFDDPHYGLMYTAIQESGYTLAIGAKTSASGYLQSLLRRDGEFILRDILLVSLMVVGIVIYSFRDLRQLVARIRQRGSRKSDPDLARSSETFALMQGLKGFQDSVDHLKRENTILKGQVLPALQKELASGRKPPYEFSCTLVRTDINGFTQIFSGHDRARFMHVINQFFNELTHVVSRYKGYVYEFVGDEVIFYFKDEDHENSTAIALSALRDINRLAERMNETTQVEDGYPFRIKSSLAWGMLRFGPLVNGHSLAGTPLIETVRILSHVHEKSENTILFDEASVDHVAFLCSAQPFGVVVLKGLDGPRPLYSYQAHVPLSHHLRQGGVGKMACARYYRSDEDICEILDFIAKKHREVSREECLELFAAFRSYRVTKTSLEVRSAYLNALEALADRSEPDVKLDHLYASLIASATHLFTPEAFSGRLRQRFIECLSSGDRRAVANALDVFSELDPSAGEVVFAEMIDHADNRILANALVKEGKRNWTGKTSRRLRTMLNATSAYYKASGLFALGEIARHLRQADEVAFNADFQLQKLIEEAHRQVLSSNVMVRRQAIIALLKSGRQADLWQLLLSQDATSAEVRNEIRSFMSEADQQQLDAVAQDSKARIRAA